MLVAEVPAAFLIPVGARVQQAATNQGVAELLGVALERDEAGGLRRRKYLQLAFAGGRVGGQLRMAGEIPWGVGRFPHSLHGSRPRAEMAPASSPRFAPLSHVRHTFVTCGHHCGSDPAIQPRSSNTPHVQTEILLVRAA